VRVFSLERLVDVDGLGGDVWRVDLGGDSFGGDDLGVDRRYISG
jgi:hypothetical protein